MHGLWPVPWFARPRLAGRSREIVAVLTRHELDWLMAQVGLGGRLAFEGQGTNRRPGVAQTSQAEQLRLAFGELGGTFIKLGQMLGARPDLFPPEYAAEMAKLQDAAPPVPWEQVRQVVLTELA